MAITKLWSVKSRLDSSLKYIENPDKTKIQPNIEAAEGVMKYIQNKDKTENCLLISSFNCNKDDAYKTMIETKEFWCKTGRKNGVVAYHLVQSFKDFETTPEIAHKCGVLLAERLLADKYEVVVATHTDHKHLHNHLVFNSVSFRDGKSYRRKLKEYFIDIRGISDQICRENCLSVIEHPKGRGLHYAEWKAIKECKPTIRGQMREEIDEIIKCSYTMKEFWKLFSERGYIIHRKGENIKHISIIAPYAKRPVRLDSLGEDYTIDAIGQRIIAIRNGIRTAAPTELSKKQYKVKGSFKNMPRKKLKGFQALYFHYLYLFKKIRKKRTSQRVSFFMREELIKLDRYQKQFKFLFINDIETGEDLSAYQKNKEDKINELIIQRKTLYEERTDENCDEIKDKAAEINKELTSLRCEVRMCKNIFKDAYRISEKKRQAEELQKQAEQELKKNEYKRRIR